MNNKKVGTVRIRLPGDLPIVAACLLAILLSACTTVPTALGPQGKSQARLNYENNICNKRSANEAEYAEGHG